MEGELFLIRHCESTHNANPALTCEEPDHAAALSPVGLLQAENVARNLLKMMDGPFLPQQWYVSDYLRTRQTAEETIKVINNIRARPRRDWDQINPSRILTTPFLREQERCPGFKQAVGDFEKNEADRIWAGKYYYRFPGGESCADVHMRLHLFVRDMLEPHLLDGGSDPVIVSHGTTLIVLLHVLMGWPYGSFDRSALELCRVPENGHIIRLRYEEVDHRIRFSLDTTTHPGHYPERRDAWTA